MSYCGEQGIPHSEFLEWDEEDRSKVLAWKIEEAATCQMCGTTEWKWKEDNSAYEIQKVWCKGCYLKEVGADEDALPGTTIRLIPRAEAERIQGELPDGWGR